jgi:MFS family permease
MIEEKEVLKLHVDQTRFIQRAIFVCALGYFIDIFDIQLFAVLRVASLTDLGVAKDQIAAIGGHILNVQMFGMILGAFLWGWLGDRFGRLKSLYGSILLYSLGTLASSLVQDPITYGISRFTTGFGLAGETGGAITLVSELMSQRKRGWGVTIIGGIGSFGPVLAIPLSMIFHWRTTYMIAGLMGLFLLVMRLRLIEPQLFEKVKKADSHRGSLKMLCHPQAAKVFLSCIALGMPTIFMINLLNFFSLELGKSVLRPGDSFDQKLCMFIFYSGLGVGGFLWTALSQITRSRRLSENISLWAGLSSLSIFLLIGPSIGLSPIAIYAFYFVFGSICSMPLSQLMATELFGTNIRATATIATANLMRGSIIPMIIVFQFLRTSMSIANAAAFVGIVVLVLALLALLAVRETYGIDLDYTES